jgi:hypothetical protein
MFQNIEVNNVEIYIKILERKYKDNHLDKVLKPALSAFNMVSSIYDNSVNKQTDMENYKFNGYVLNENNYTDLLLFSLEESLKALCNSYEKDFAIDSCLEICFFKPYEKLRGKYLADEIFYAALLKALGKIISKYNIGNLAYLKIYNVFYKYISQWSPLYILIDRFAMQVSNDLQKFRFNNALQIFAKHYGDSINQFVWGIDKVNQNLFIEKNTFMYYKKVSS